MGDEMKTTRTALAILFSIAALGGAEGDAEGMRALSDLAIPFERNAGQLDPAVAFAAQTPSETLFITREGVVVHALTGIPAGRYSGLLDPRKASVQPPPEERDWALVEMLVGTSSLTPNGLSSGVAEVSRFTGSDPAHWHTGIGTYGKVRLGEAWPGITVDLVARGGSVEKLFTVAPGADAAAIAVSLAGSRDVCLSADGSIVVETGNGPVTLTAPVAYQTAGEVRLAVPVRYRLAGDGLYGFELGAHDEKLPVVIDPILQATYLPDSLSAMPSTAPDTSTSRERRGGRIFRAPPAGRRARTMSARSEPVSSRSTAPT